MHVQVQVVAMENMCMQYSAPRQALGSTAGLRDALLTKVHWGKFGLPAPTELAFHPDGSYRLTFEDMDQPDEWSAPLCELALHMVHNAPGGFRVFHYRS